MTGDPSLAYALLGISALFALVAAGAASGGRRSRRVRRPPAPPAGAELFEAAQLRLRASPFDRMSPPEREGVVRLLERADQAATLPASHARIHLMLAEMALVAGDRERALDHFRTVLRWNPGAPVRRTIESLERRTSPTTPISDRLAA
ncbi:MAG TPA: hypothetical protein VJB14_16095 [Planctomycetota bacterium]|nr:hypothetical protein [Planctomycetota bacterium]